VGHNSALSEAGIAQIAEERYYGPQTYRNYNYKHVSLAEFKAKADFLYC